MREDRHMFPGGNTPAGFYSYYRYILPQDAANHIFVVKGGPGVGKSTFMKRIGEAMGGYGHPVEYMHCSSDPGSLDGLVIPGLRTALLDGTAPHVIDPQNPGAVDEIVNLGQYWSLSGIKERRGEIVEANAAVGRLFERAYRYLRAAKMVYDERNAILARCADIAGAYEELEKLMPLFSGHPRGVKPGRARKLFASAITPDGFVNYLGSLLRGYRDIYALKGEGPLPSAFLKAAAEEAARRGLDTEEYYCPMEPGTKLEHLLIPALSLAFTVPNAYHDATHDIDCRTIDFDTYLDRAAASREYEALQTASAHLGALLREAVAALHNAKQMHDRMETYYIPHMDFKAITALREEVLERILSGT
jgi:hypothetical protein